MLQLRTLLMALFILASVAAAQNAQFIELPGATVGTAYNTSLKLAATGAFPFHLSVTQGSLPSGLNLAQNGSVQGTPTVAGAQLFVVTIADAAGKSQQNSFRIQVAEVAAQGGAALNPSTKDDPPPDVTGGLTTTQKSALDFGAQVLGAESAPKEVQFANSTDGTLPAPMVMLASSSVACNSDCDFVITENACTDKIVAGATCHVQVAFLPHHAGPVKQQLKVNSVAVDLTGVAQSWGTPATRMVAGVDASAASSADTKQQFFIEAMLTAPLRLTPSSYKAMKCGTDECSDDKCVDKKCFKKQDPLDSRLWIFANPKILSVPQSASAVSSLNVNGDFFNPILNGNTTNIVQAFDLKFGTEMFLVKPRDGAHFWAEYPDTEARLSVALVAMGGFTTPFSTQDRTSPVFVINDSVLSQFPNAGATGKTNIAFVTPDRSRFFRSYYGGLRFKTYFFSTKSKDINGRDALYNLFPGTTDLTVGQDESITGGMLRGAVLRVEGVYPLPYQPAFHIFASGSLSLSRNINSNPLNLVPAASTVAVTDSSVLLQTVPTPNRDSFRIGLGLDLIQLFNRKSTSKPGGESTTSSSNTSQ